MSDTPRPTALYRFYDDRGQLLYVGITYDTHSRWKHHAKKPWWPEVNHTTVEWLPDRTTALIEEGRAIRFESPRYNVSEGASEIGWRTIRIDRAGPYHKCHKGLDEYLGVLDLRRVNITDRLEHVQIDRAHTEVALDGRPAGVFVPWDWYEAACAAAGDPVDLDELIADSAEI